MEDRYCGKCGPTRILGRTFTDDQLLAELRIVSMRIGGEPVTRRAFNQHADMHSDVICRRFDSWGAALKKAEMPVSKSDRRYSDDDLFENLLAVWTWHGRQPIGPEMNQVPSSIPMSAYKGK